MGFMFLVSFSLNCIFTRFLTSGRTNPGWNPNGDYKASCIERSRATVSAGHPHRPIQSRIVLPGFPRYIILLPAFEPPNYLVDLFESFPYLQIIKTPDKVMADRHKRSTILTAPPVAPRLPRREGLRFALPGRFERLAGSIPG